MDTEHLENPDYERLDDSYRSMERLQELSLSISGNELATTLNNLEKIGYVALRIKAFASSDAAIEILASKGKHGPCYDTERKITYTGSALAVMDDDLHLLIKNKDNLACEKTASIYQFAAYNNYLDVSPANKDLLEKLKTSPVNFDCNDYEDNLQALLKSISDKSSADETVQVFYQGPFKYLILADGAMLRRGEDNTVSKSQASELISGDACFMSTDQSKGKIRFLSELYKEQGSACLLEQANVREQVAQSTALNLDALETVHADLRSRLLSCIETRAEYFILIG
ncbi:MAG: hypothetical protein HRT89_15430, partial [Lentisphaeria bacterium]|nr:hypothetical protein [Lentisphaeria bacterium]